MWGMFYHRLNPKATADAQCPLIVDRRMVILVQIVPNAAVSLVWALPVDLLHQLGDALILGELGRVLALPPWQVSERWSGSYATAPDRLWLVDRPDERVRVVIVTSGNGASTAFGLAEDVIDELA